MIQKLKPKSEFSRNVLTLMTGTTIAQAIPIAISPILTRIYSPEDFGIFALYMSIVSIFGVIVTGQYELAIMLPKNEKDAFNIFYLSILLALVISCILLVIIIIFNQSITSLIDKPEISNWLYLIPISILFTGLFNSFNYLFNRNKEYKLLAKTKVTQSFVNSGSILTYGFFSLTSLGFISSYVIAQFIAILFFLKQFKLNNFSLFNKSKILILAKKYKKFPKITMPHSIFSNLSQNLPILILSKYFTSDDVGFFSFGNKIVGMPLSLVSNAYYQVFFQSFREEKDKLQFYKQKFKQVNLVFLPLFVMLWFLLPDIFSFIFGEKWKIAGEYSQILLPLLYMKFLSNLFTTTTYIYYQKQEENFIFEILITIIIFLSLVIGVHMEDIKIGLIVMMLSNSIMILVKLYRSYQFVKEDNVKSI